MGRAFDTEPAICETRDASGRRYMNKVVIVLVVAAAVAVGGGAVLLGSLDLPAPGGQVEKVIPDQRFPRQ